MFKEHVKNLILSSMSETNANVAMSMIYGDTTNLDETIQEDFENIGVSHLMSVSGTHITSYMLVVNLILRQNKSNEKEKNKKNENNGKVKIKCIIQIFSICLYIVFTGFSVSVLRAGIMLIIYIITDMFNINKSKYIAMLIALLVILLIVPYAIFNVGMQLSFLATLGIIMFTKYINYGLSTIAQKIKNNIAKKAISFLIENISITMAVQLLIIPIQINAFNKLPFPVIFPNLIMGIISLPIRIGGTIGIMLSFIPSISSKMFSFVELFVKLLLNTIEIFKMFAFNISTVSQPAIFSVIYYIFVFCIYIYLKLKNISKDKEGKYNYKKLLKYLKVFVTILLILIITMAIFLNIYSIYFSEYVYFFNVEQGDMSYIKSKEESVIVDIGSLRDGIAFNTISNYFKVSNLTKVNVIIISHMHKDHINGLEKFLQKYEVGTIIYTKPNTINEAYINFKNMLRKYNVEAKEVKEGEILSIGKIKIEVLLPDNEYIKNDEVNANSLVCKITINDKELLYMGDANKEAEEKLINKKLNVDNIYVLKVGHHGSKTATSREFIQKIKPKHAVISALKKYYGHPHESTIDTLKYNKVYTYLTELQGAIKFSLK